MRNEDNRAMPILELKNVHKAFQKNQVLRGVDLNIRPGEGLAVIGPSGSGKSSLLKCINMLIPIDSGKISFRGQSVIEVDPASNLRRVNINPCQLRQKIGIVFQEFNLWPNKTIRQNIIEGPTVVLRRNREWANATAERLLAQVGLTPKIECYPHELSGGQRQRAAIARALAMEPDVLMFDEVTSALDPLLTIEVLDVIARLKGEDRTLLIVTHHMQFARSVGDRVAFFWEGRIHELGEAKHTLDNPRTTELRDFLGKLEKTH